jgi:hypothetical protein
MPTPVSSGFCVTLVVQPPWGREGSPAGARLRACWAAPETSDDDAGQLSKVLWVVAVAEGASQVRREGG